MMEEDFFSIDSIHYLGIISVATTVVLLLAIKEFFWDKRRTALRILASTLLVISITCIALRPLLRGEIDPSEAVLLTRGYSHEILDSIQSAYPGIPVYYRLSGSKTEMQNIQIILNIRSAFNLTILQDNLDQVFLLGEGIKNFEKSAFETINVTYYPADRPSGIVDVLFNNEVVINKISHITGNIVVENELKLVFNWPEGKLDSIYFTGPGEFEFDFKIKPKLTGKQIYYIEVWEGGKRVAKEPVPVVIKGRVPINVLILSSFPTPETRFLKKFLAEENHSVMVRDEISRNRFRYEFFNMRILPLGNINTTFLESFDIIIIDQGAWQDLTSKERDHITIQVENKGLGVLIHDIFDEDLRKRNPMFSNFVIDESEYVKFSFGDVPNLGLGKSMKKIRDSYYIVPLQVSHEDEIISAYSIFGIGKVGIILTSQTYELMLGGKKDIYSEFWSRHIERISSKSWVVESSEVFPDLPLINEPIRIKYLTDQNNPVVFADAIRINLKQDFMFPKQWEGEFWTKTAGWHQIGTPKGDQPDSWFYVFDSNTWESVRQSRTMESNRKTFSNSSNHVEAEILYAYQPVSLIIFFVLALICLGFLWLEPKL